MGCCTAARACQSAARTSATARLAPSPRHRTTDKIARQAADAVRRSGKAFGIGGQCSGSGSANHPVTMTRRTTRTTRTINIATAQNARFGNNAGSRRLFSRIQQSRKEDAFLIAAAPSPDASNHEEESKFAHNLFQQIIHFLRSRGGEAPTGLVVDAFADKVSAERRIVFRNLLKQCAKLERNPSTNDGMRGFSAWVLKNEFRI